MDEAILRAINRWAEAPAIALLAQALSSRWMLVLVAAPLLVLHLRARRYVLIASVVLVVGVSDLLASRVIKPLADRERPCRALTELEVPLDCGSGRSFPSVHAANAFGLAVAAGIETPHGLLILLPIAALVSLSRIVLGQHWPSDVLGGALLGAILGLAATLARRRIGSGRGPGPGPGPGG